MTPFLFGFKPHELERGNLANAPENSGGPSIYNQHGRLRCRPYFRKTEISVFMPKKKVGTQIVAFKESMEKYARPEIFTCSADEADEILELLDRVCNQGDGPIDSLSYTEFVEEAGTITLAELSERFADELAELEEDDDECSGCGCEDHQGEGCRNCVDWCTAKAQAEVVGAVLKAPPPE